MKKQIDVKKICSNIDSYEFVSFDVFDTLIKRNVKNPEDIFYFVEFRYNNLFNENLKEFKNLRIKAENEARKKNKKFDEEVTLDEIYSNLNIPNVNIDKLKKIEIETEIDMCQLNKDFYQIYNYSLEKNKKIIIISDMYLPIEIIKKMLSKCGINKYEKIYLSNSCKCNKRYGKIYDFVIEDLKISKKEIIHIGDSKRSDFLVPNIKGIKSVKIPTNIEKTRYNDNLNNIYYNSLEKFINNNLDINKDIYYNIGYEVLGCILYGYSNWLKSELQLRGINKVFFLAREGNLLKKAFDILNDSSIKTEYLYVSRKSTRVALLKNVNSLDEAKKILRLRRKTTLEEFLELLSLDVQNYNNLYKEFGYCLTDDINTLNNFEEFFNEILDDVKKINSNKEKFLLGYLKQQGFLGKVAVADVGWVGTMQKALQEICKEDAFITGFYIGKSDKSYEMIKDEKNIENFLFGKESIYKYEMIHSFLNLFESFFLSQHGTTLEYEEKENCFAPVLDKYEYSDVEKEKFINIQNGAIQFIKDFRDSNISKYMDIKYDIAFRNVLKLGTNPNLNDLKLFENIDYIETTKLKFINAKSLFYYLFHIKRLYIDFSDARWKIGFLKKIFKINLNYYKIYSILLKLDRYKKESSNEKTN